VAKRVRTFFGELPEETRLALRESGRRHWTSSTTVRKLKEEGKLVVTPIKKIREIIKDYEGDVRIRIVLSKKPFSGKYRHDDGLSIMENGECIVYLHPVLQYYDDGYIRDVIEHEIDHCKVSFRSE